MDRDFDDYANISFSTPVAIPKAPLEFTRIRCVFDFEFTLQRLDNRKKKILNV